MKTVDVDIKELVRTMGNALKFVQNSMSAEFVLSQSQCTVEKLLRIILASSRYIREYVDAKKIGNNRYLACGLDLANWSRRSLVENRFHYKHAEGI